MSWQVRPVSAGSTLVLLNDDCGSVVTSSGGNPGQATVILPPFPPENCEFAFAPSLAIFYVSFNGQYANMPGYEGEVTQRTIPVVTPFRTDSASMSLIFNGQFWEQSSFSSPIYQTAVQPTNSGQFVHGQVYFKYNGAASRFELCPYNGPGGIIIDGAMRQVPMDCLTLAQSETASSQTNYFYATRTHNDNLDVSNVDVDPTSQKIRVTFKEALPGTAGDQVAVVCHSIAGAIQVNVSDAATITNIPQNQIELLHTSSTGLGTYSGGGFCVLVHLSASMTGHETGSDGVEMMIAQLPETHYTLVGMAHVGSGNAVADSPTQRNVASWFNRHPKKMLVSCNSLMTTTSTTLKTPSGSTCEGQFVVFDDPQGSPAPAVQWFVNTGISNSVSTTAAGNVTACFGTSSLLPNSGCANTPEPETGTASMFSLSKIMPIGTGGLTNTLSEGLNYMDLLGDTSSGTMTFLGSATNNDTTIGAVLMQ